jgi:prepilin-type N-terminal cleavage/methylation domain-containing protein
MKLKFNFQQGFTLVEVLTVMLVLVAIASITVESTKDFVFQGRYDITKDRYEKIKKAIIGDPNQVINGQPNISGFVADMGRLPTCLRELIDGYDCETQGLCSNPADTTKTLCLSNNGTWTPSTAVAAPTLWSIITTNPANLGVGWRGSYLSATSDAASNSALADGWGRAAQGACYSGAIPIADYTDKANCEVNVGYKWADFDDYNYGWHYKYDSSNNQLFLRSYGKNQTFNNAPAEYDTDYPNSTSQTLVNSSDWGVDISSGINVSFIKTLGLANKTLPPISFCTDPTKITKSTCLSPETWYGGCSLAGYLNKTTCETATGTWIGCSNGSSTTKTACESANKYWYGEGFGCSDKSKTNKVACITPAVWRSCTDDGTIQTQNICISNNQIWYGTDLYNVDVTPQPYQNVSICMQIFYRQNGSTISVLTSDEDTSAAQNDAKTIVADGSFQILKFSHFRDSTGAEIQRVPIGINAVAIYPASGMVCSTTPATTYYPNDRTQPTQILFAPHTTTLPTINW